jgi:ATP-dependent DNA helicase DinG
MPEPNAESFFAPDGPLSRILPGYERRPQQGEMARRVEHALTNHGRLAIEAGTGVGKSLAYLVPAALWTKENHKRVAVSTYTRLLQTQLISQDVPLLSKLLGEQVRASVAFGQENYLCRFRLENQVARGLFDTMAEAKAADKLFGWADKTETGVILDYPHSLPSGLSSRICRDSAMCRREKCQYRKSCFYLRARESWEHSSILIVNHSLLFADLATEADLLPESDAVILDEAHRIEDAAIRHFGNQASEYALTVLLDRLASSHGGGLVQALGPRSAARRSIQTEASAARVEIDRFFRTVDPLMAQDALRARFRTALDSGPSAEAIGRLAKALDEIVPELDDEVLSAEMTGVARRLGRSALALEGFRVPEPDGAVHWAERSGQGRMTLLAAPLDVAPLLRGAVYDHYSSTVLTSATMTVAGSFSFLSGRLGLDGFETESLDSPFDYQSQSLLYVPDHLPLPTQAGAFNRAAADAITAIIKASMGRALVLFTSYDSMNAVFALMPQTDYNYLQQGDTSPAKLLDDFREDTHSVLFATQSFWQGIDVPGEALSCLVICRLPFEVPDDPRLTAIAEKLKAEGISPFTAYQLPTAVLRFRQGFGRLIRAATDRGVVCVLDKRILAGNYSHSFLKSLPKGVRVTTKVADIDRFFAADSPTRSQETAAEQL